MTMSPAASSRGELVDGLLHVAGGNHQPDGTRGVRASPRSRRVTSRRSHPRRRGPPLRSRRRRRRRSGGRLASGGARGSRPCGRVRPCRAALVHRWASRAPPSLASVSGTSMISAFVEESWSSFGWVRAASWGAICRASTLPSSTPHWSNESIDPDCPLREDAVLVEGDESAEAVGADDVGQQDARRAVPLHHAVRETPARARLRLAARRRSCRTRAPGPARTRSRPAGRGAHAADSGVRPKPMRSSGTTVVPWWTSW